MDSHWLSRKPQWKTYVVVWVAKIWFSTKLSPYNFFTPLENHQTAEKKLNNFKN